MPKSIPKPQSDYIVKLSAQNVPVKDMNAKLKRKFGVTINKMTITNIRRRRFDDIQTLRKKLADNFEVNAQLLQQKSYTLLDRKLDRALQDDTELSKLKRQRIEGSIDEEEYAAEVKKYESLTINELTKIADSMHNHTKGMKEDDEKSKRDAEAEAALELLVDSLRKNSETNNPVLLIKTLDQKESRPVSQAPIDLPPLPDAQE